jgi:hypothetical protein
MINIWLSKSNQWCKKALFVGEVKRAQYPRYQHKPEINAGDTDMTHTENQLQASPLTLSMMVSEGIYKAVVGVERLIRRICR